MIIGPKMEPKTALNVMEIELMEKVNSPNSNAFEVPIAWDALPKAIPLLTGFVMWNKFKIRGPKIAPVRPAIMTKIAVNAGTPPNSSEICTATGVVNDFGNMETAVSSAIPASLLNRSPLTIPANTPRKTPPKMTNI